MKVLFAGPSLYRASPNLGEIELRPPAAHGDLAQAVIQGASAIGLVDGNFEAIAAVWHKEILFALEEGVVVVGAASMGALRAAECAEYGMIPIGKIANEYCSGLRDDDADVAVSHGPIDLGCPPLTTAMVDVEATVQNLRVSGYITDEQSRAVLTSARMLFFKERTTTSIVAKLDNSEHIKRLFRTHFVSQKQIDALELIRFLKELAHSPGKASPRFEMQATLTWTPVLERIRISANHVS